MYVLATLLAGHSIMTFIIILILIHIFYYPSHSLPIPSQSLQIAIQTQLPYPSKIDQNQPKINEQLKVSLF